MDKIPLRALIFASIPEAFSFLLVALALTKSKFKWQNLFYISVLGAVCTYFIRLLPVKFGFHIIIEIPILIYLIKIFFHTNLKRATLIAILGIMSLSFAEIISLAILYIFIGIPLNKIIQNNFLRIIIPLIHITFLIIIGLYLKKKNIYIFDEDFLN